MTTLQCQCLLPRNITTSGFDDSMYNGTLCVRMTDHLLPSVVAAGLPTDATAFYNKFAVYTQTEEEQRRSSLEKDCYTVSMLLIFASVILILMVRAIKPSTNSDEEVAHMLATMRARVEVDDNRRHRKRLREAKAKATLWLNSRRWKLPRRLSTASRMSTASAQPALGRPRPSESDFPPPTTPPDNITAATVTGEHGVRPMGTGNRKPSSAAAQYWLSRGGGLGGVAGGGGRLKHTVSALCLPEIVVTGANGSGVVDERSASEDCGQFAQMTTDDNGEEHRQQRRPSHSHSLHSRTASMESNDSVFTNGWRGDKVSVDSLSPVISDNKFTF